jgi:ribosomal protein L11 methyltransferase
MTTEMLVMVAVDGSTAAATAELAAGGAWDIRARTVDADRSLVSGSFPDEVAARAVVALLRQQGWVAAERPADDNPLIHAWRNRTRPVQVGDGRLVVALPWAEYARAAAPVVEIDPGQGAFGVGSHPTTCLLLEALAARLHGGETILDVGCGSGVLALAAVKLGAASAVGIDLEPAAVAATRANAQRNGLADRITALPTPLPELTGRFDVVLANIGQEVLLPMAPELERHLSPCGWLGLSGISPAQVSRLSAAFPSLTVVETPQLDDWAAILAEKSRSSVSIMGAKTPA